MEILLTNDDGFFAPGLQTLFEVMVKSPEDTVSIVAPDSQRSASGHSITLFDPLFVTEHPLSGSGYGYAVRGTPSDCVKLAVEGGIVPKPDLVISGINQGPNLGTDIFYSGTVAAAMEGVLAGIPAIAASLASFDFTDFEPAARWLAKHVTNITARFSTGLLNVNFPGSPGDEWKGVRVTRLGRAVYENVFESRLDPHGRRYFWQGGTLIPETDPDTDVAAIHAGYVTVTPMHSDLTDYKKLEEWQGRGAGTFE
ncbi:5'/3'-nucleotidase SurE [Acididesulfobacillus acetoxydans]|nr:5'/3'-nucleotidase SurE [Acididesulfobacillus acetoxydans]